MSIISFSFIGFLFFFFIIYFISPKKIQWIVLLAGNLFFYSCAGSHYLIYLAGFSFITWYFALKIERNNKELKEILVRTEQKEEKIKLQNRYKGKNKILLCISIILTMGSWAVLKYGPFAAKNISILFRIPSFLNTMNFIVPLGMSFYTFDAAGYLIDISHGKYTADNNYFHYLTFISYFPHIIQGPFDRYNTLGKTLFEKHSFSFEGFSQGFGRILWGYLKKLIIADKLAIPVTEIFTNYESYSGIQIFVVMILYGIQLYADFSGYIDIVSGVSHILGIEMAQNFKQPYFSVSIEEFWRRWHISLGQWFRDYVFFPIFRSERAASIRKKYSPKISRHIISFIAMFWVWTGSGLWHGANWTFLLWGWLNMAIMFFSQITEPIYTTLRNIFHISLKNKIWKLFRVVRTFFIVCFLFFITRADSVTDAIRILQQISRDPNPGKTIGLFDFFPCLAPQFVVIVLTAFLSMACIDFLSEIGKWNSIKEHTPFVIRDFIYVILIISLILFAGNGENIAKNFIYANF